MAAEAIEDAGGADRLPDRDRVGVVLGRLGLAGMASMKFYARVMSGDQITRFIKELVPDITDDQLNRVRTRIDERLGSYHPENVIGLMSNLAASRIANRLNLRGASYTLDAACASSLIAVDHAVRELTSGRLDAVIAGGTHHNHDVSFWAVFTQIGALSPQAADPAVSRRRRRPAARRGSGMVVLKRLADALRDGDRIYAVIRGVGVASDGRSASLVSPETAGQVLAIRRAWEAAGLDPAAPDALGLLEAHGTATAVGDAAEVATMGTVFGPPQPGSAPVIGSVKSQIGHTLAAAGVAGLVKAALAVSRGVLLPTLHCDNPRPELESTRFRPIPSARPWESTGPRRAAVNAFGFGGINAHVILEQAPEPPRPRVTEPAAPVGAVTVTEPEQVLLLAGQDRVAITRLLDADDLAVRASGIPAASGTEAECQARRRRPDRRAARGGEEDRCGGKPVARRPGHLVQSQSPAGHGRRQDRVRLPRSRSGLHPATGGRHSPLRHRDQGTRRARVLGAPRRGHPGRLDPAPSAGAYRRHARRRGRT